MRTTATLMIALLIAGLLIFGCSTPVINLGSARIYNRHNFSAYSQFQNIEHHSLYKGTEDWRGDPFDRTANEYGLRYSYGVLKQKTGIEYGMKIGKWQHFHWHYREGSSTDYFPYVWIDTEGAEVIHSTLFLKYGINQHKPLKIAFVIELPAAGAIVSYDFWKLTPYVSGRLSLTKYESDNEKSKIAFLPAIGMDIRLTDETIITLEGGIIRDYYRKDDLYATGFSVTF